MTEFDTWLHSAQSYLIMTAVFGVLAITALPIPVFAKVVLGLIAATAFGALAVYCIVQAFRAAKRVQ